MTRASENPQAWNELLIALGSDDVKTARKIANKYGFYGEGLRKNKKQGVYIYHVVDLEGNHITAKSGSEMDQKAGFTQGYTRQMTDNHFEPFVRKSGKYKGWTMWREEIK